MVPVLSVARGYDPNYLLKEVATGRESYYTGAVADGEPPGRWWGAGAEAVGLSGEVAAQDMTAVYKHYLDPREDGFQDPARWDEVFTLGHAGRAYKTAEQLYSDAIEREPDADAARRDELRVQAAKAEVQNVAFLDVTFSVPKSVTLLHTAFEAEEIKAKAAGLDDEAAEWAAMRETVEEAIWAGNQAALSYLQEEAGYARVGHHGGAGGRWVEAHSWIVASFFQHDSREHDPQLHIHNGVFNRQQCADGTWRTLDSRAIYRFKPAAAAISERTTSEFLVDRLWVSVAMRPDGKAREVTCVRPEMRDEFSTRSAKITPRTAVLVEEFTARYGREPNAVELDGLKRAATEATRPRKSHTGETHERMVARVRERAARVVEGGLAAVAHTARQARDAEDAVRPVVGRFDPEQVIADAIEAAQAKNAFFTYPELLAEVDRLLPDTLGLPDGTDVRDLLVGLTDQGWARIEDIDAPVPGDELIPDEMRLANGRSPYDAPGRRRGTTSEQFRSENRLRAATQDLDGVRLAPSQARAFVTELREAGIELGVDQAAALTGILCSGARVETLIGPAGTGKSFVVGSLARAWSDSVNRPAGEPERRVFGLATAQVAADVLAAEGLTASNVAAWLATQHRLDGDRRGAVDGDEGWRLRRGDVVVVDESSMADTAALADIHRYVDAAGAKMLLVGDPRQLAAVGAGGLMELVAEAGARYELADARRFTAEWERAASLRLRAGDQSVVQEYHRQGRLLDAGTLADAEASASRAWLADTLAGHRSLLVVDTNDQATRVAAGLRDGLVRLGYVAEYGVELRDRTVAGVGDVIQGRRVAWELAGYAGNPRGPVNREHYRVTAVRSDGSLEVEVIPHGAAFLERTDTSATDQPSPERLVLPPEYVAADVTLAYAVTKHAAEGATVHSSHAVVTGHTDAPGLYVELSRGTTTNVAHVATVTGPADPAQGDEQRFSVHRDPRAVIGAILDTAAATTDDAAQSATAARDVAVAWAGSVQTAAERFGDVAHEAALERTARHLDQLAAGEVLGPQDRARIAAEDGTAALARLLRQAELAGHDPRQVLHDAVAGRDLGGARQVTDVLLGRIREAGPFEPTAGSWAAMVPTDIAVGHATYLDALAQATDTHTAELGAQAAEQPPRWALDVLGPVPAHEEDDDGTARAAWEARAGAIAAHREIRGYPALDDTTAATDSAGGAARAGRGRTPAGGADVLGSAPSRRQVETYGAFRTAHRATGSPNYTRENLERSDAFHRAVHASWRREMLWNSPAYTDGQLAGTRQAEAHQRQTAELRRAEAVAAVEPDERDRLVAEARHADALADTLADHVVTLEHAEDVRGHWLANTAIWRAQSDESEAILAERGATADPDHEVTADEWLAADRAARTEDDPYRDISEADLDDQRPRDAHQTTDQPHRAAREQVGENTLPDRSDDVAADRAGIDQDSVHAPDADEVERTRRLAAHTEVELRNRAALDAQHEAEERAAREKQLARWHYDDHAGHQDERTRSDRAGRDDADDADDADDDVSVDA